MELKDSVIVVTGASSGIGLATSRHLSEAGAKVLMVANRQGPLDEAAKSVRGAATLALDVTEDDAPEKMLAAASDTFGRVDGFVNNAGMMVIGAVDEIDKPQARMMLRVNTEGAIMASLAFAEHLKGQGAGAIIHTSSIAGHKTTAGLAAYNASKFAIEAFSDALRLEMAGTGVKIMAIAPGTVQTALYDEWKNDGLKEAVFAGGALTPEDVADVIVFALSRPDNVDMAKMLVVPPTMAV